MRFYVAISTSTLSVHLAEIVLEPGRWMQLLRRTRAFIRDGYALASKHGTGTADTWPSQALSVVGQRGGQRPKPARTASGTGRVIAHPDVDLVAGFADMSRSPTVVALLSMPTASRSTPS